MSWWPTPATATTAFSEPSKRPLWGLGASPGQSRPRPLQRPGTPAQTQSTLCFPGARLLGRARPTRLARREPLWTGGTTPASQAGRRDPLLGRARVHLERDTPPKPLWLGWMAPASKIDWPCDELWRYYRRRAPLEQAIRYRAGLILDGAAGGLGRGLAALLVTLAQWTLSLAREVVAALPGQRQQLRLTPGRVRQGMGGFFVELGTPVVAPQRRGSPPGWPVGRQGFARVTAWSGRLESGARSRLEGRFQRTVDDSVRAVVAPYCQKSSM